VGASSAQHVASGSPVSGLATLDDLQLFLLARARRILERRRRSVHEREMTKASILAGSIESPRPTAMLV
jgi:hypothetical protein